MAYDEDRRWRERMRDEGRRQGWSGRPGGERRDWSEGSGWRNRDQDEWSSSAGSSYGSRGDWDDRDRWREYSGSDWEETSWRDLDRDRGRGYEHGGSRNFPGRDMGQSGWSGGAHDRRQDRDYGGSMRAGEYGSEMGGRRSWGDSGYGGRSGMGYGGGQMGSRSWSGREYDQYAGMTSEPGFGAGYGAGAYRRPDSGYGYGGEHDWGRSQSQDRGFFDKAADEVSSWFGDEEAERRREMDRRHSGRGPRNYARSDSRIHEDVCDRLTEHPLVDASDIDVSVSGREVTLSGTVHSRDEKRRAEDIAEAISGVTNVQNNLRVKQHMDSATHSATSFTGATGSSTASPSSETSKMSETKTTGTSPGVMRSDPSTSTTRGA
jgi:osmotically-inducible protein OsmY